MFISMPIRNAGMPPKDDRYPFWIMIGIALTAFFGGAAILAWHFARYF